MPYEILKKETIITRTLYVTVKFDFLDTETIIPIVNPENDFDVIKSIENREISERAKLETDEKI